MDTKPVTEVFPLDEGNESITQRRGWIKINIIGPPAKACCGARRSPSDGSFEKRFPRHFVPGYDRCCSFATVPGAL
jgi:hypothetical protein